MVIFGAAAELLPEVDKMQFWLNMLRLFSPLLPVLLSGEFNTANAETIRVPQNFRTIQSAINSAAERDVVLVSAANDRERIGLKSGATLKSAGHCDQRRHR